MGNRCDSISIDKPCLSGSRILRTWHWTDKSSNSSGGQDQSRQRLAGLLCQGARGRLPGSSSSSHIFHGCKVDSQDGENGASRNHFFRYVPCNVECRGAFSIFIPRRKPRTSHRNATKWSPDIGIWLGNRVLFPRISSHSMVCLLHLPRVWGTFGTSKNITGTEDDQLSSLLTNTTCHLSCKEAVDNEA